MIIVIIVISAVLLIFIAAIAYRHQCLLRNRAQLMRDAMRHRDFSFRLPTKGLLFGERALQEALNDMGYDIEKLVAFKEVESWQRLTRVLTHEIMNVITPIRSITQTYIADSHIKDSPYEEGIRAIHSASASLADFVSNYRKLTQLQNPVLTNVDIKNFCNGIASLFPELKWVIEVPSTISLLADENLLQQVFVNLVKNALEAQANAISIKYLAPSAKPNLQTNKFSHFGKLLISNNGHIIPDEIAREIFIPFFTTKKGGSGIGLSLSRQILFKQGITLTLAQNPIEGYNVTFILE